MINIHGSFYVWLLDNVCVWLTHAGLLKKVSIVNLPYFLLDILVWCSDCFFTYLNSIPWSFIISSDCFPSKYFYIARPCVGRSTLPKWECFSTIPDVFPGVALYLPSCTLNSLEDNAQMIFDALALAGAAVLVRDSGTCLLNQLVQAPGVRDDSKKENHKKQSNTVVSAQYLQGKPCLLGE